MKQPQSRQPPCQYFGQCAGCDLQDIEYSEQLEKKHCELSKLLNLPAEKITIHHGQEFGYRNRMEFLFSPTGVGLRSRSDANKIITIGNCPICAERINLLLAEINSFFIKNDVFNRHTRQGIFRYAVIRATSTGDSISFVLNEKSQLLKDAIEKIKEYSKSSPAKNILITYTTPDQDEQSSGDFFMVKGESTLTDVMLDKTFTFSSQGFFQNNTEVAGMLQKYVRDLLKGYGVQTRQAALLDLYAGVGTFGIINSELFSQVFIVESFPGCTASAQENLKLNNTKNARIFTMEAHSIGRLKFSGDLFVITDPPRSGMAEKAIEQIKRLKPKAIIYISCNPLQLAKDIPKFKSYNLESVALFDMFPQTRHMEAVAELKLKTA